ncbi:MAG: holo-ACP synthase [Chloroflexota bacterium]
MLRCGIDAIEIDRVAASYNRFGDRFLRRFFTPPEAAYCNGQPHRLAARIAAKEAVAKALGTGIGDVSWQEIEIYHDGRGRPLLRLHGAAADVASEFGLTEWDISLTHSETVASAICVMR